MKKYLIVPEGLAFKNANSEKSEYVLSPIYIQVLDFILKLIEKQDVLYLAPGNDFQSGMKEQFYALLYLKMRFAENKIVCFDSPGNGYVDTLGNAVKIMHELNRGGKENEYILICERIHSYRAEYCFKKAGIKLTGTLRIKTKFINTKLPIRLWHQKNIMLQLIYESAVYLRDLVTAGVRMNRLSSIAETATSGIYDTN